MAGFGQMLWTAGFVALGLLLPVGKSMAASEMVAIGKPAIMMKINVTDLERSATFYTTYLGLKISQRVEQPTYRQVLLNFTGDKDDSAIILHYDKNKPAVGPLVMGNAFNDIALTVTDLDGIAKRLKNAGQKITDPLVTMPAMIPPAKIVAIGFTVDPDGYRIELVEWRK